MRKLSLFSGIGGIDLAAQWAGMETVAFCEREPFPQRVLKKHWPGVPIYDDVYTLTRGGLERDGIISPGRTIDIISGGFPCQPFSIAGEQLGTEDDRYLWPEMFRVIKDIMPRWVVGENVANFRRIALDDAVSDLEGIGYTTRAFIIPACAVGADNRRDRVFIVANTCGEGLEGIYNESDGIPLQLPSLPIPGNQWKATPRVLRRGHGVSDWVDRIKGLGNAVNPYQIYPIMYAIKTIDDWIKKVR